MNEIEEVKTVSEEDIDDIESVEEETITDITESKLTPEEQIWMQLIKILPFSR